MYEKSTTDNNSKNFNLVTSYVGDGNFAYIFIRLTAHFCNEQCTKESNQNDIPQEKSHISYQFHIAGYVVQINGNFKVVVNGVDT